MPESIREWHHCVKEKKSIIEILIGHEYHWHVGTERVLKSWEECLVPKKKQTPKMDFHGAVIGQ